MHYTKEIYPYNNLRRYIKRIRNIRNMMIIISMSPVRSFPLHPLLRPIGRLVGAIKRPIDELECATSKDTCRGGYIGALINFGSFGVGRKVNI